MGETTVFSCSACGYESSKIRWGAGSMDATIRFLPALCRHCRDIVEIELTHRDLLVETFTCPVCDGTIFFFERAQTFTCPRCGAPDMSVLQHGYW